MIFKKFLTILLTLAPVCAYAQVSSPITVSGTEPAATCISLSRDSRDMDVIVKFVFDEQKNSLTVSLFSYRGLFVFREKVKYSKIFCCSNMNPEKLPYEVQVPDPGKFKATSPFRKSIKESSGLRNYRKYVFSRWIDYEGLQPQPCEFSMVNDRIEQTFDILEQKSQVNVTLKDIILMDPHGKEGHFAFVLDRNVNKSFDITIKRDPCFGKDEDVNASAQALSVIRSAYDSLKVVYGNGVAPNEEAYQMFNGMKTLMTKQFTKVNADSKCGCIKEAREKYNMIIDSIALMKYKKPVVAMTPKGIDANKMLSRARRLDVAVGKWLNSKDSVECHDLMKECETIIAEAKDDVVFNGVYTVEQREALDVFLRARRYYEITCRK